MRRAVVLRPDHALSGQVLKSLAQTLNAVVRRRDVIGPSPERTSDGETRLENGVLPDQTPPSQESFTGQETGVKKQIILRSQKLRENGALKSKHTNLISR